MVVLLCCGGVGFCCSRTNWPQTTMPGVAAEQSAIKVEAQLHRDVGVSRSLNTASTAQTDSPCGPPVAPVVVGGNVHALEAQGETTTWHSFSISK